MRAARILPSARVYRTAWPAIKVADDWVEAAESVEMEPTVQVGSVEARSEMVEAVAEMVALGSAGVSGATVEATSAAVKMAAVAHLAVFVWAVVA